MSSRLALCAVRLLLGLTLLWTASLVGAQEERPKVLIKTDSGEMVFELFPKKAPKTVTNFLTYVDDRFYDGTIFHRVVPGFVVQGGGMTYDFTQKETRGTIPNESDNGLSNEALTLAMARESDPDSADSQFFINLNHNRGLDATKDKPGYTVFGRLIKGLDTVITIVEEPRGRYDDYPHAPNTPVRVLSARRLSQGEWKNEWESAQQSQEP